MDLESEARRHQGVVSDGRTIGKHLGIIKNRIEAVCGTRGGHQRALSRWTDGWWWVEQKKYLFPNGS